MKQPDRLLVRVSRPLKQRETGEAVKQNSETAKALEWLAKHPDLDGLSIRKAAEKAGVHYSTLNRAYNKGRAK